MRTIQILIAFLSLTVASCNEAKRGPTSTKESKFVLESSELKLISDSLCDLRISIASLNSISQYDSISRKFLSIETNTTRSLCIEFTYQGDINAQSKKLLIHSIPTSYGTVATTIPAHSILHITSFETSFTSTIAGNEFHNGRIPTDSLHNYISRLFLNPPYSSKYGEKRVILHLPNDGIHIIAKYLTEVVIGYIAAQRQICMDRFHKDLKAASLDEIKALKECMPFRFTIIPVKITVRSKANSTVQY